MSENIEIPNYEPSNLTKNKCELLDGSTYLCSKGPSFISTPNTFDWTQLQTDFDKFKNALRKVFLTNEARNNTNKITALPLTIGNSLRKQSLRIPAKNGSNETETFISLVEKDLFQDTSRKRDEKNALKDCRKNYYLIKTRIRLCIYKTRRITSLLLINKQIMKKPMSRLKGVPFSK